MHCVLCSYAANQVLILYKDYIQPCLSLNKSIFIWLWETWVDYWMWHQSDSLSLRLCDTKNHWAYIQRTMLTIEKTDTMDDSVLHCNVHRDTLLTLTLHRQTYFWISHSIFSGENPRASQRGLSSVANHPGQNYFCHLVSTVPVIIYLLIFHMPHLGPM